MLTTLAGCGSQSQYERVVLTGTVSFKGQPIQNGRISLRPRSGTSAPSVTGAYIVDGQYRIDHKGGVPAGAHSVEIEAYRRNPNIRQDPNTPGAGMVQYLPGRFNRATELELVIASGSSAMNQDFLLE